jgi:hypothetical protein
MTWKLKRLLFQLKEGEAEIEKGPTIGTPWYLIALIAVIGIPTLVLMKWLLCKHGLNIYTGEYHGIHKD